ncbi:MAG: glycerol-3-phosphate dehydrogenase/oxidase [Chloroflexi bacterium]|nr:glycerol-3-phosphate dehydrogenase/oxidase [Chloroflexota bacterium]
MRRASLQQLAEADLDLLVVGGGIVGCGIARDAALRGLRVGLLEREDFASGTTSRSTRLVHGGLRYLELLDFGLVRSDMQEREILLRIAPHLVRPLPFLVPTYRWPAWKRDRLRIGMALYDLLSYDKSLPWHRALSRTETLREEPGLNPDGLQGAARYYDAQVEFPERLALANALDASDHGGLLANYVAVERFAREDDHVVGAVAVDTASGQREIVRARLTVNATGPWLDRSLGDLGPPEPLLRTTKGAHLVMPMLSRNAVLSIAHSDARVFFVVPWFGYSLVGTTDTDFDDDPSGVRVEPPDVDYLVRETARTFPEAAHVPIHYGMAGVRALVRKEGVKAGRVSRKHAIRDHADRAGPNGLISVLGGKITAYRAIAEEVSDLVVQRLGWGAPSRTAWAPLPGGDVRPDDVLTRLWPRARQLGLTELQTRHLVHLYGSRAREVVSLAEREPRLAFPLCSHGPPAIKAQVRQAITAEGAVTLADVLLRRVPVGLASCQALDCLETVAREVGDELGWDQGRQRREIVAFQELIYNRYRASDKPAADGILVAAR